MNRQTEWWQSFFSGLWLDAQRQAKTEEQTRAEADAIEKLLQLAPGAKVLDVPCGQGRLSIELASRGYHVTGVDITRPLLDDAQRKAIERQLEMAWEERDMRDLPWHEEFDGAFCVWGSFGYFDGDGNAAFIKAVSRALKPGARFLVDLPVAETVFPNFRDRAWGPFGDTLILQAARYDHVHGRVDVDWTLVQEGKMAKSFSSIRIYTYGELCRLLEEAGFTNCEGYASMSQEPFKLGSPWLYLVATKDLK
ncbi:MAG: class I SAM-dependent methyltransferase [Acidobacteria bacterium]|nr:class I SAM-dependent methyltransferase [Acidobacteriota bacterium]